MAQRSGLALAVLALAVEEPMHPYRMQQLIRERGKDRVVNVGQRSQLYKTIDRLVRDGLLAEQAVEREATRPERTVYTATEAGRRAATEWTVDMLVAPRPEFGEFAAALAYLRARHRHRGPGRAACPSGRAARGARPHLGRTGGPRRGRGRGCTSSRRSTSSPSSRRTSTFIEGLVEDLTPVP